MDAVRAENLTRAFGGLTAVDGLSFTVSEGELFGLVGPDGAGKTTALRMLSAVLDPTRGDAWVAGLHTVRDAERIKERIGYVSQQSGLYADLSVEENLRFYADLYGVPRRLLPDRLEELYAFSRLGPFRRRAAGDLSGGMRQKLSLACALVHTPRVLFLDEPTNGVDPVSRRDLWQILRRFAQQGVTVVVSTAYLDEAERCTRLALVHRGALLAAGTPAEVRGLMRGALCEVRAPDARRAAGALRAALPQGAVNLFGDRVHVVTRDGEDAAAGAALVGRTLARAGVATESVRPLSPSLEDVFVSLLARREPGEAAAMEPAGASAPAPVEDSAAPAIAVRDLEKRFGSFTAVRRVSLELRRGEIFGLLGPNGAGKSTTLRMLCGILAPSGGTGTVAGFDLRAEPERVKARIGYMSQKFSLYGELTVEENLNFYGGIYGLDPARKAGRKAWVLAMAGLQAQRRTRVEQLPTGWKQRLALGCAILHEPSVVFLDEPTSGVDPISRRRFWDLIHALAGGGVTTLVTTHHMDEAEYCNRVALIYGGERIALGTPSELKQAALDHPAATMEEVFLALVEARDRSAPQTPEVRR